MKIVKVPGKPQSPVFVQTRIADSSAASQSVGPPLSNLEVSFNDVPNGGRVGPPFVLNFGGGPSLVLDDRVCVPAVGAAGCTAPTASCPGVLTPPVACGGGLGTGNTP